MATAEFTIEPFVAGEPGPHVTAALDVARRSGLAFDVGPFGSTISGEPDQVVAALADVLRTALSHGATRVSVQLTADIARQ